MTGRPEEGLRMPAKSPDRVVGKPCRFAEIYRVAGALMLAKATPDRAAERLFQDAITIVREEGSIGSAIPRLDGGPPDRASTVQPSSGGR